MLCRVYWCIVILLFLSFKGEAQELPLIHYTPDSEINALPSAMVTHIHQDREGFIWMTVFSSGLIRFDGARMDLFNQQDGLRDLGVWQMLEDGAGHLWVTSNGGLVVSEEPLQLYINGKRIKFVSEFDNTALIGDAVTFNQMTVDGKGRIWIGTIENGLIRYQIDNKGNLITDTISTGKGGGENIPATTVMGIKDGSIIAGLLGGILIRYSDGQVTTLFEPVEKINNLDFATLFEDKDGKIWAYRQNGEVLPFLQKSAPPQLIAKEQESNFSKFLQLNDGTIWANNSVSGIIKINQKTGQKISSYTRENGLLSNNVFHVFEDREKNVWIAQSGGVSKLRFNYNAFENFSARSITGEKPVLPSGKVNTVFIPEDGVGPCRFWVGTEGGATCIDANGVSEYITQVSGLVGDWVNGLVSDPEGRLWIATTQGLSGIVFDPELVPDFAINLRKRKIFGVEGIIFSIKDSPPIIAAETLKIYSKNHDLSGKCVVCRI